MTYAINELQWRGRRTTFYIIVYNMRKNELDGAMEDITKCMKFIWRQNISKRKQTSLFKPNYKNIPVLSDTRLFRGICLDSNVNMIAVSIFNYLKIYCFLLLLIFLLGLFLGKITLFTVFHTMWMEMCFNIVSKSIWLNEFYVKLYV